jgi:hypothetical protein
MTDPQPTLDEVLERVVAAARVHLAAVRAAEGKTDDEQVWRSFVALNNASHAYDQALLDAFGEGTPWDTEVIDVERRQGLLTEPDIAIGEHARDPYPSVVSVRQRRDYRVPSVAALLRAAGRPKPGADPEPAPATVGEAVLALLRGGDGTLSELNVPELEPLAGEVTVAEVGQPPAGGAPEPAGAGERVVARLDEQV